MQYTQTLPAVIDNNRSNPLFVTRPHLERKTPQSNKPGQDCPFLYVCRFLLDSLVRVPYNTQDNQNKEHHLGSNHSTYYIQRSDRDCAVDINQIQGCRLVRPAVQHAGSAVRSRPWCFCDKAYGSQIQTEKNAEESRQCLSRFTGTVIKITNGDQCKKVAIRYYMRTKKSVTNP